MQRQKLNHFLFSSLMQKVYLYLCSFFRYHFRRIRLYVIPRAFITFEKNFYLRILNIENTILLIAIEILTCF